MDTLQHIIESTWNDRDLLKNNETQNSIRKVIKLIDSGELRVAEPTPSGWQVNEWVKAVVLYFPIQKMETLEAGPLEFHDKMPLKRIMQIKEFELYHMR